MRQMTILLPLLKTPGAACRESYFFRYHPAGVVRISKRRPKSQGPWRRGARLSKFSRPLSVIYEAC
jgi:hypothetical protein